MSADLSQDAAPNTRKHLLQCNRLLAKRVRKTPWIYSALIIFLTFAILVPFALLSTGAIPWPQDEREMWDYVLSYILFAVANFLFWVRIYSNAAITLFHLFPFPLSSRRKFALLLTANLTDYRAFAYMAVTLTFILSSSSPHTTGIGMAVLFLLFLFCIEVWLLNVHLAGLPVFSKYINAGYLLAMVPFVAFWLTSSFQLYGLFKLLPFTVWIAEGLQAARTQDWMSFALHLAVLVSVAAAGLALGSFLCTRTYLLSARGGGGASE